MSPLRFNDRFWNECPQCGNRGFKIVRQGGIDIIECQSCYHTWMPRSGDWGQANRKGSSISYRRKSDPEEEEAN